MQPKCGLCGYSTKGSKYFCDDCSMHTHDSKIPEGPATISKKLFDRLSIKWPAVKWIKALLAENKEADKWMLDLLETFLNDEYKFTGKREWPLIHVVRIMGEKGLVKAAHGMVEIYNRHHDEYDRYLVDGVLAALKRMGPKALDFIFPAFEHAKDDELKTTYLGIMSELGVRDDRIKRGLIEYFDLDPFYGAGSIAEYGDKSLLPFLYEKVKDIAPVLKIQIPTSREESFELNLYIELRDAIVDLERGFNYCRSSFSWEDYYRQKGRPAKLADPKSKLWDEKYDDALKEFDRRFLGDEIELFCEGDDGYDEKDPVPFKREIPKPGRNDPCLCGSGKKFKKCCLEKMH